MNHDTDATFNMIPQHYPIPGLSVPLTGAMDLVEGNFTPVDFKSAAAKPDAANAAFDHEIQLVS